ncbi:MAG: hypothetical protein NXI04_02475 [Planctomycetaceae bacterium]|nr:hypothetical protein [Planctomycetaceae bacterium]
MQRRKDRDATAGNRQRAPLSEMGPSEMGPSEMGPSEMAARILTVSLIIMTAYWSRRLNDRRRS